MVLVVKYRKSLISAEVFEFLKKVFVGISERYFLNFQAIGSDGNHIHILIEAAPRYSPSRIMQICKSISAIQIFKQFPNLKKDELWGGEFWSDGGHIDTVGDGFDVKAMEQYIKQQGGYNHKQSTIFQFASP